MPVRPGYVKYHFEEIQVVKVRLGRTSPRYFFFLVFFCADSPPPVIKEKCYPRNACGQIAELVTSTSNLGLVKKGY